MEPSEHPLEIQRKFEEEHPGDHLKFMLKKGGAAIKTAVPTIKLTKIPFRIYCDFVKPGTPTFKPVLVSENMTSSSVVFLAIEKFNIKSNLTIQDYCLVLVNDETGVRRTLAAEESPLLVKNEVGKKVQCYLVKAVDHIDHYSIRIFGSRVWFGEGYKTVYVTSNDSANEAVRKAIEKFKYKNVDTSMLQLVRANPDGTEIPTEKPIEGETLAFKEHWEEFALVKTAKFPEIQIAAVKVEEPVHVSEMDATAEDVRKLLASDAILNMGDESLGDIDVGDLDSAFANMSDVSLSIIPPFLKHH